MLEVGLTYSVTYGRGDGSEAMEYGIELTDEEESIYCKAVMDGENLNYVSELHPALNRAREEIAEMETENAADLGDPYAMECIGLAEADPDEINMLVEERDPYTMEFFGLNDLDAEELAGWDAYDEDLPRIKDFEKNFEPSSPFDDGWELSVDFDDPDRGLIEELAEEHIRELFKNCGRRYSDIYAYVDKLDDIKYDSCYDCDFYELAEQVAEEMGIEDFGEDTLEED